MRSGNAYNTKNVLLLVIIFAVIVILLYSLTSFLHESRRINQEIESIREENQRAMQEIAEKEKYLLYLNTDQRIEKEAKSLMGKRREGEKVIVVINEDESQEGTQGSISSKYVRAKKSSSMIDKWLWLFFRE